MSDVLFARLFGTDCFPLDSEGSLRLCRLLCCADGFGGGCFGGVVQFAGSVYFFGFCLCLVGASLFLSSSVLGSYGVLVFCSFPIGIPKCSRSFVASVMSVAVFLFCGVLP